MALNHTLIAALVLASLVSSSHPLESQQDQYAPRKDNEATDKTQQVNIIPPHMELLRKTIKPSIPSNVNEINPNQKRQKRSYYPWRNAVIQTPKYQSFSVYKPPMYQLSRPYYIPIYGVPGRLPIYFPPQPLLINPGQPLNNPNQNYQGPTYLPPGPTPPTVETNMTLRNRFEDDAPIWGSEPAGPAAAAGRPLASEDATERPNSGAVVPTRLPRPSSGKTHPPLIHGGAGGTNTLSASESDSDNDDMPARQPVRPPSQSFTTQRPPAANEPSQSAAAQRPQQSAAASPPAGPSPCVWAIISCCSATSNEIRYNCFEQRGCQGAFWGASPCESDFARAAIASALNYYNSK